MDSHFPQPPHVLPFRQKAPLSVDNNISCLRSTQFSSPKVCCTLEYVQELLEILMPRLYPLSLRLAGRGPSTSFLKIPGDFNVQQVCDSLKGKWAHVHKARQNRLFGFPYCFPLYWFLWKMVKKKPAKVWRSQDKEDGYIREGIKADRGWGGNWGKKEGGEKPRGVCSKRDFFAFPL